jgi:hypothetical protein
MHVLTGAGWTNSLSCHIAVETCDTAQIQPSTWRTIAARPCRDGRSSVKGSRASARSLERWRPLSAFPLFFQNNVNRTGASLVYLSRPDQEGMVIVFACLCRAHKRQGGGTRLKRLTQCSAPNIYG